MASTKVSFNCDQTVFYAFIPKIYVFYITTYKFVKCLNSIKTVLGSNPHFLFSHHLISGKQ